MLYVSHVFESTEPHTDINLGTIVNLSFRLHSAQRSYSLGTWKYANAITGKRFIFGLPYRRQVTLVLFLAITLTPAALWAGALTPTGAATTQQYDIDMATQATYWLANGARKDLPDMPGSNGTVNNVNGVFSFRPEFDIQSSLLASASTASAENTRNGISTLHAKLDKTGFSYHDRSYGVGASAGLADDAVPTAATNYTYYEPGILTNMSCIYNDTAALDFNYLSAPLQEMSWLVSVWELQGQLPDGTGVETAAATILNHSIVLWQASGSYHPELYIGIAVSNLTDNAHGNVSRLNNIQCSMTFAPTNFSVLVDVTNRTFAVNPLESIEWPIGGQNLSLHTLTTLNWIAESAGSGFYESITGLSLANNIANLAQSQGYNDTNDASNATVLEAVADSFLNMIDNAFVAFASAKIMVLQDTTSAEAQVSLPAATFGSWRYIYPVAILNGAIVLLCLFEALRTRGWSGLSKFDFMDVPSVIVGASAGGMGLAHAARQLEDTRKTRGQTNDIDNLICDLRIQHMGKAGLAKVIQLADAETTSLDEAPGNSDARTNLRKGGAGHAEYVPLADVEQGLGDADSSRADGTAA